MEDPHIDPLKWAESVGLEELVKRFPDDVLAAWRDARRDLDDLPPDQAPVPAGAERERSQS